jgi:glycosyltransferase involved in cell wall biosynthesis
VRRAEAQAGLGVAAAAAAPTVSVIVPAYNAAGVVATAVRAALEQTVPALEILVVDDGSRDATAAVAGGFPPPVRCLRQANQGLPGARNSGIAAAQGDWLAFLDADDAWPPDHLEQSLGCATRNGADFVFSDAQVIAPGRQWASWLERAGHGWLARAGAETLARPYELLLRHGSFALPSTVVVRRAAVDGAGRFDARLRPGPEDLDLWLRLAPTTRWAYNRATRIVRTEGDSNLTGDRLGMAAGTARLWTKALDGAPPGLSRGHRRLLRRRCAQAYWEQAYWSLQADQRAAAARAAGLSLRRQWRWRVAAYWMLATLPAGARLLRRRR